MATMLPNLTADPNGGKFYSRSLDWRKKEKSNILIDKPTYFGAENEQKPKKRKR